MMQKFGVYFLQGIWKPTELCISGFVSEGMSFSNLVPTAGDYSVLTVGVCILKSYMLYLSVLVVITVTLFLLHLLKKTPQGCYILWWRRKENLMSYWTSVCAKQAANRPSAQWIN